VSVITIGDDYEVDLVYDVGIDAVIDVETTPPGGGGGEPDPPTDTALVHDQATPAATWTIPHLLGRLPVVAVYLRTGEVVDTDLDADTAQAVLTFPAPTAGWAVLV
jgi:hypothetical protein